jgi:hypothetical protein
MVGIIIDDVVISSVIFIGPLESACILKQLLSAVTTPNKTPSNTVKYDSPLCNVRTKKATVQTA